MISRLLRHRPPCSALTLLRPQIRLSSTSSNANTSTSGLPTSSLPEPSCSSSPTGYASPSAFTSPESANTNTPSLTSPRIASYYLRISVSPNPNPNRRQLKDAPLRPPPSDKIYYYKYYPVSVKDAGRKLLGAHQKHRRAEAGRTTPYKPPLITRPFGTVATRPYVYPSASTPRFKSSTGVASAGSEGDSSSGGPGIAPEEKRKKTLAELDEELKVKLESLSGGGGEAGLELEGGVPVAMKRGVRENMFRLI